jgi:DNA-binding PadR family transcriptional regulator
MDEAGWIRSEWKASDNNRRARYYKITAAGRRQLAEEKAEWLRAADAITRVLRLAQ